jgi:hypothetical protein
MRHTPFYALGLLLTVTQATLGFEDSNNHYLRRHAHKHRRKDPNENVGVSIDIDVDVHIGSGHGGSKDHPSWKLTDDFKGKNFYEHFTFEAIPDPTHGRVK